MAMNSSETQESMNINTNAYWPGRDVHNRTEAKRIYDCRWSWPRKLSFLSSEEVQELPYEIQLLVCRFLFGIPKANKTI